MWHTPDEQAHFGQIAFMSEFGRNPGGNVMDSTREIYISEQLLGTFREKNGNNKFTFHPEYRIEYTDSYIGKYEAVLAALSSTTAKKEFVFQEASKYPPLYYIPGVWIYKALYTADLFTRVYSIRIWSLLLFTVNIFVIYQIGGQIFLKNELKAILLAVLAGFQPMMVFANVGVNSDALGNLLFSIFLYTALRLLISGIKVINIIFFIITLYFALQVKVQFIVILPLTVALCAWIFLRDMRKKQKSKILPLSFIILIIVATVYSLFQLRFGPLTYTISLLKNFDSGSFIKFSMEYTLPHTYREVMPWFWGIYNWLGVTYPRWVHRIINIIVFLAILGFLVWLKKVIQKHQFRNNNVQGVFFLLFAILFYFVALSTYDWVSWHDSGFQLGVQGRYFFPLISAIMIVVLIGWESLIPSRFFHKLMVVKALGILMILLNVYGLYTLSAAYYNVSSLQIFLLQASQYKPWFMKGNTILFILISYVISLLVFVASLLNYKEKK
jgi:hypothetical protein